MARRSGSDGDGGARKPPRKRKNLGTRSVSAADARSTKAVQRRMSIIRGAGRGKGAPLKRHSGRQLGEGEKWPPARLTTESVMDRLLLLHLMLDNAVGDRVSYKTIGEWLGEELHRIDPDHYDGSPISESTTYRYETERELTRVLALGYCAVFQRRGRFTVDPGWLMFGDDTQAPAPDTPLRHAIQLLYPPPR